MPMAFTLRQLEYFVAVAERGSVTAAAAARNVSQPSVSLAILDLEKILGRTLFRRQAGQSLTITSAGRQLLLQARTTLSAASQIGTKSSDTLEGDLSIACFRDLGSIYLPRALTTFAKRHHGVSFTLAEGDLDEVLAKLLDGRCELAITYDIDLRRHGVSCRVLDRLAPHILLSLDHRLAGAAQVTIGDLVDERIIIENFPVTLEYFTEIFRNHGVPLREIQLAPSFEMQRGLVANGWGIGLSCVRPLPDVSYDGAPLACIPLSSPEPMQEVVIAHLGERTLSPIALQFLNVASHGKTGDATGQPDAENAAHKGVFERSARGSETKSDQTIG